MSRDYVYGIQQHKNLVQKGLIEIKYLKTFRKYT